MKKIRLKALLCASISVVLMITPLGCSKKPVDSSSDTSAEVQEYGDPDKCTLCPDKNHCCFCYEYGDCVCVTSDQSGGKDNNTSGTDTGSGTPNRRPSDNSSNGGSTATSEKYDPSSLKGKTITIMRQWDPYVSGNNTAHDNWNKRVAELEKKYQFDIVEKKWSATLEQEVLAGVKPAGQLYQVNGDWVANYARQGFIASWDDAMKTTGIDMTSDVYFDFSVQLCNYNNKQYAIGVEEGKLMSQVVYNKTLTSQFADIEKLMDTNQWTWDKMTEIAKSVKAKYPDKWGIGLTNLLSVYGMVASNGGQLVSISSDGTLGSNLKDKKVQQALEQMYNWIHVDKVATVAGASASWDYLLKELIKGNIAFTFNEEACYDVLKAGMNGDDYGIAYLPMGPSANQYYACMESSWPYVVPKAYEDETADLLFVVDALYQLQPGYTKDTQLRDLYIRKFSSSTTYSRVKSMHRDIKCAPIIEIELASTTEWSNAMTQLFENKTTVGALIDARQNEFDTYMKDTWKNLKFTGNIS